MDIYARKSVDLRGRRGELSSNAQIQRGRDWADWNRLRVRTVWEDKLSASKDVQRPDYDKALQALADGEVKTLWCYKLDRFSRKGALAVLSVLKNLEASGARIIFGEDGLDTSNPDHRRMIMWRAEDAYEESQRISKRVVDTKDWQRNAGEWVSGRAPYGLVPDENRKLVPDTRPAIPGRPDGPTRARVVQGMFRLAALGLSLRAICRALYRCGIPATSGKPEWGANAVYRLLRNAAFSGWQVHCVGTQRGIIYTNPKGERVRVGVALVSDDLRLRATRALAGHSKPIQPYKGRAVHLLTGLTKCTCGRAAPASSKSYVCTSVLHTGNQCPAPAGAFRPPLERYVVDSWLARLTNADPEDPLLAAVASRWAALTKPEESAELQEAMAVLSASEATLERLLRDRRAGLYEGPAARFFEPAYAEAMESYNHASRVVREHGGYGVDITFLMEESSAREAWEEADLDLRRNLLRLAIDRVVISKAPDRGVARFDGDSRVTIHWAA
jgi:DNA invertase Pin-like site-specific DNA recombinase